MTRSSRLYLIIGIPVCSSIDIATFEHDTTTLFTIYSILLPDNSVYCDIIYAVNHSLFRPVTTLSRYV